MICRPFLDDVYGPHKEEIQVAADSEEKKET